VKEERKRSSRWRGKAEDVGTSQFQILPRLRRPYAVGVSLAGRATQWLKDMTVSHIILSLGRIRVNTISIVGRAKELDESVPHRHLLGFVFERNAMAGRASKHTAIASF
jgi:hypothetical protein